MIVLIDDRVDYSMFGDPLIDGDWSVAPKAPGLIAGGDAGGFATASPPDNYRNRDAPCKGAGNH